MKRLELWLGLYLFLTASPSLGNHQDGHTGYAFDPESGAFLYAEEHNRSYQADSPVSWWVAYRDSSGQVFAQKQIRFGQNPAMPSFLLEDARDGYVEGAEVLGDSVRLFTRKTTRDPLQEATLPLPEQPLVIDAGFTYFVQQNWDTLMQGRKVQFLFAAPFKLKLFKLRLAKSQETRFEGIRAVALNIEIDNFLIRLFVDPIVLTYAVETRKLLSYEGATNINDDRGKSYVARVLFPDHLGSEFAELLDLRRKQRF